MSKQRIAVLMGGPSSEHDVSLHTGASMLQNLDDTKYQILRVTISRTYQWQFDQEEPVSTEVAMRQLKEKADIALLALHGTFGEDGTIQALLDLHRIPYTGSGVGASVLAMDKTISGELFEAAGLLVPKTLAFEKGDTTIKDSVARSIEFPVVVKPSRQGSSVGVHIVKDAASLQAALEDAFSFDRIVVVQQYVQGREVACGVLEHGHGERPSPLPPTELIPKQAEFFDYEAKYTAGMTDEITPPDMAEDIIKKIQHYAVEAHQVLGCSSYSRTDMIVTKDGEIYIIELNNLPGMTETSLLPQQAAAANIGFPELLDSIISNVKTAV